jgi:hypothetical protein
MIAVGSLIALAAPGFAQGAAAVWLTALLGGLAPGALSGWLAARFGGPASEN